MVFNEEERGLYLLGEPQQYRNVKEGPPARLVLGCKKNCPFRRYHTPALKLSAFTPRNEPIFLNLEIGFHLK